MFELKGVYTPVATPFEGGEIAYDKLAGNLDFLINSKIEGLVVMGSNGEFVALREQEKIDLVKFICEKARGKKKIIVGIGGNCLSETLELAELAKEQGADAVLVVTPYYYKNAMKDAALEKYFTLVADQSPLPVVLYNMPGNTGVNTSSSLLVKLSAHPNIIGVKDTSGNISQIAETIKDADASFNVFAGNWSFLLPSLFLGAKGATLALGNIAPNECAELVELYEKGDYDAARVLANRLLPVNAAITAQYGIGGMKAAMDLMGLAGGETRSPLNRPNEEVTLKIKEILQTAGLKIQE
ncbi:4-hydroxy-tetrahydrodipicolinate synthase [Enterococcus sp. AZ109]|uniref:4-hydroxy-tetrahydrodipicolinate synthase n=1 Tax=Enterococcus sp. AZ109 TaxID=2774634 RepID=UPI003F251188